jgi:hypothetical protein
MMKSFIKNSEAQFREDFYHCQGSFYKVILSLFLSYQGLGQLEKAWAKPENAQTAGCFLAIVRHSETAVFEVC